MNTHQGEKANDDAYDTGTTAVERKDRGICLHACRDPEAGTFTALPGSLGKQLEHPFLSNLDKLTVEQWLDYIRCMTVTKG